MADATTLVTTSESWLKQHERLIIVALCLLVGGFLTYRIVDHIAASDQQKSTIAAQQLAQQKDTDAKLLATAQETAKEYAQALITLSQQNAALSAQQASRTVTLVQQQSTDKTLPLPDLAKRMASLAGADATEFSASSSGITLNPDAAIKVAQTEEQVPVLKANLDDETTKYNDTQKALDQSNTLIGQGKDVISGLQVQLTDQKKADDAVLTAAKAEARKSKLKWFGAGYVAGWVSAIALKVF